MVFRGAALAGARPFMVGMCASKDKVIGERRTIGSAFICESCNGGHGDVEVSGGKLGDVFGTAKGVSECSRC